MNSFKVALDRRAAYVVALFAIVFATIVPALVSAAQITERSIALSNSSADMDNVTYQVKFTATQDAGAFVIDFCNESPVIGATCTAPTGFSASGAATSTSGYTLTPAASRVTITKAIDVSEDANVDVVVTGINNPTNDGAIYARIVTYDTAINAGSYPANLSDSSAVKDTGSVALYITPTVGVQGTVMESLAFCIAKNAISPNCDLTANPAPNLTLGQEVNGVVALNAGDVYEGTINTQLSTNAAGGAVIRLKSNATGCGGLLRAGAPGECDIKPALQTGIAAGEAKFGLKLGADVVDATDGTLRAFPASGYNASTFALNFAQDQNTGVTSTYGDPLMDTDDKPATNRNMPVTFGASVSNTTPAGTYSADLSMIATGKF